MSHRSASRIRTLALLSACALAACSSSAKPGGTAGANGNAGTGTGGSTTPTAGSTGAGGSTPAGGATGTGGTTPTGGATGTGGTTPTGGAGGSPATGGMTGGTAGTPATGGVPGTGGTDLTNSVLERNKHPSRDGFFIQPTLTKVMAAKMAPDANFKAMFTGSMWASPLYLENGPAGKGVFFAVTTSNMVYALDETTGAIVWMHSIGQAPSSTGGCVSIQPIGIISTPVIDAAKKTIYVAGGSGPAGGLIAKHEIHALSTDDGTERAGWPVDVSNLKDGTNGVQFHVQPQIQRSALSLVNGILYVGYGGHRGDCSDYHGWVVAVDTSDPTKIGGWATAGRGEAIWASGGMASDGNGVIAVTSNRNGGGANHQDSEEVVRVTGLGTVDRAKGIFYPGNWQQMDNQDADFGSNSPVVVQVPGGTPSTIIAAASKDGHLYLLNAANFGNMTPLQDLNIATGGAMNVHAALAAYQSTSGPHVVFNTHGGAPCNGVVSVKISAASPPQGTIAWCKGGSNTSPIATSPDGKNDVVVWYVNGGKLNGLDGETGDPVLTANGNCGGIQMWTSPIAVKGRIVAGGDGHLCSWSAQ
jgi:outer membrane protein assembly factor BamB